MDFVAQNSVLIILILASLLIIVLGWLVFLQYKLSQFSKKQKELFAGKRARDLEDVLNEVIRKIQISEKEIEQIKKICNNLNSMATKSIQKVGILRFNPFPDTGGDLSFAVALLDSQDSGVVISSLHGRGGTRIYSKPIILGESKYNLSAEEKQAIEMALKSK